jgi:hypothetical protein
MMRLMLLAGVLAGLGWWYFIGGRTLDEADVRAFYAAEAEAVRKMDVEALCDLRSAEFIGKERITMDGQTRSTGYDKTRYCELERRNFNAIKQLMNMAGKEVSFDLEIEFKSIKIAQDRKSASVEYVQRLLVDNSVAAKSKIVEELNKRNGTVRSLRAESSSEVYDKLVQR